MRRLPSAATRCRGFARGVKSNGCAFTRTPALPRRPRRLQRIREAYCILRCHRGWGCRPPERGHSCPQQLPDAARCRLLTRVFNPNAAADGNVRAPGLARDKLRYSLEGGVGSLVELVGYDGKPRHETGRVKPAEFPFHFCYARDLERQHQFRIGVYPHLACSRPPAGRRLKFRLLRASDLQPGQLQARGRSGWQGGALGPDRQGLRVRKG